jgi:hypothetical protein
MVCIRANKPGSVCARSSCNPRRRVARRAGGPPLTNALPGLSAYLECNMVAPATPRLEFVPQVNLSRMFLFRAADALDAGRIFEAGCLLRESVRRQLFAECAWKGCLPAKQAQQRSPLALLHALEEAGHSSHIGVVWTKEIIELCNKCAHCVPVDARMVRDSIAVWHDSIDNDPCGEPTERTAHMKPQPEVCDCDDDDDDHGDDWKIGGAV